MWRWLPSFFHPAFAEHQLIPSTVLNSDNTRRSQPDFSHSRNPALNLAGVIVSAFVCVRARAGGCACA